VIPVPVVSVSVGVGFGVAIAAVLSVSGLTYFVGHTGAQATWAKRIGPVATPKPTPTDTETTGTGITAEQVATQQHSF